VLIADKVDASCVEILKSNGLQADLKPGRSVEELKQDIKNYDALIVRSATKATAEIIECGTNLKLIGRAGTGVDNIDIPYATSKGILVMNTPAGNTLSAAEHTCALISAVSRHIGQGHASLSQGLWERAKFMGCELSGKTLAIIGLGRIGRDVAHRMQSFGMKTIGFDPLVSVEEAATFGVEWFECKEIWPQADYVTVHTPLIPQTRGLLNAAVFDICKPNLRVINVARGGIIDEADLLAALNAGKLAGAALDVFETEPPTGVGMELAKHEKVLCTPHLGASTREAQLRVAREIAQNIVEATQGKPINGLVNAPALCQSAMPEYKNWFQLAILLGRAASSIAQGVPKQVHVDTSGDCLGAVGRLIAHGVTYGLQTPNAAVNQVNCTQKLKEAEVQFKSAHTSSCNASISISAGENHLVSGTVFAGSTVVTRVQGAQLCGPVCLSGALLTYKGDAASFIKNLGAVPITSMSASCCGGLVVASVSADAQVADPIQFHTLSE